MRGYIASEAGCSKEEEAIEKELSVERQKRGRLGLIVKLVISLSLLTLLFWKTDQAALLSTFRSLSPSPFLAALLLYFVAEVLSSLRWQLLLRAERIQAPLRRLILLYLEAMFFSLFLPTLIGGDLVRGHRIYRYTNGKEASLASILVERLSGLAALLAIALATLLVSWDPKVAWPILGLSSAFLLGLGAMFSRTGKAFILPMLEGLPFGQLGEKLGAFYQAIQRYRSHEKALGQAFVLSLILQAILIYAYSLIAQALGLAITFKAFLLLIPVATVIAMVPVSVAGLGVREGAMVYLFGKIGLASASALGLSLTWFFLTVLASLPGGVVFAFWDHRKGKP